MKKIRLLTVFVFALLISTLVWIACEKKAEEKKVEFITDDDKVSYSIGVQIGKQLKTQPVEVNPDALAMGIKDVVSEGEMAIDDGEMARVMVEFQEKMRSGQMTESQKQEAGKNIAEGMAFLDANSKKDGVKVLPSGLQYKVIKKGTGNSPQAADKVKVHYKGTLINGQEFDSSFKRGTPAEFPVNGVIPGWTEALQLMKEGGKWQLFIPSELAYRERGAGPSIPPNSALVFEVELLEVVK